MERTPERSQWTSAPSGSGSSSYARRRRTSTSPLRRPPPLDSPIAALLHHQGVAPPHSGGVFLSTIPKRRSSTPTGVAPPAAVLVGGHLAVVLGSNPTRFSPWLSEKETKVACVARGARGEEIRACPMHCPRATASHL
jgi:hypothetical protein